MDGGATHRAGEGAGGSTAPGSRPSVVVLAGPNGAGKTTVAPAILRDVLGIHEFVNADAIAAGLSGFAPESSAFAAGRVMMERLHALGTARVTFAFETTLATRSFAPWLRSLRSTGYTVQMVFVWLSSAALAQRRVASRVLRGGHSVPPETVQRRYSRGIRNFHEIYRDLADGWTLYDNSGFEPRLVARGRRSVLLNVADPEVWVRFQEGADEGGE